MNSSTSTISVITMTLIKLRAFTELLKPRLSLLVAFSCAFGYGLASHGNINWTTLFILTFSGFLLSGASVTINQIIEKDLDQLMERTKFRPMPTEVLSFLEAILFCTLLGVVGTVLLWVYTNPLSGILGFISIILYAIIYTPLKRKTPFSVFVGAFPGALPTLIGGVAASSGFGEITFFTFAALVVST